MPNEGDSLLCCLRRQPAEGKQPPARSQQHHTGLAINVLPLCSMPVCSDRGQSSRKERGVHTDP